MKYHIRIFADNYETTVINLKDNELKAINLSIIEYLQQNRFSFPIEMKRYSDPVALNVPFDFKPFTGKRILLNPFGFDKKLEIMFEFVDTIDGVHYCEDIWCDGRCGTLSCGCIDVCRGRCGNGYDSY